MPSVRVGSSPTVLQESLENYTFQLELLDATPLINAPSFCNTSICKNPPECNQEMLGTRKCHLVSSNPPAADPIASNHSNGTLGYLCPYYLLSSKCLAECEDFHCYMFANVSRWDIPFEYAINVTIYHGVIDPVCTDDSVTASLPSCTEIHTNYDFSRVFYHVNSPQNFTWKSLEDDSFSQRVRERDTWFACGMVFAMLPFFLVIKDSIDECETVEPRRRARAAAQEIPSPSSVSAPSALPPTSHAPSAPLVPLEIGDATVVRIHPLK